MTSPRAELLTSQEARLATAQKQVTDLTMELSEERKLLGSLNARVEKDRAEMRVQQEEIQAITAKQADLQSLAVSVKVRRRALATVSSPSVAGPPRRTLPPVHPPQPAGRPEGHGEPP